MRKAVPALVALTVTLCCKESIEGCSTMSRSAQLQVAACLEQEEDDSGADEAADGCSRHHAPSAREQAAYVELAQMECDAAQACKCSAAYVHTPRLHDACSGSRVSEWFCWMRSCQVVLCEVKFLTYAG